MSFGQIYNYFLTKPDPYTGEWPMLSSWYPVLLITLGYLYFIYIAGPRYMKNRPPYKLKNFMLFYNIFQILANTWILKEHIRGGWLTEYNFKCWQPDPDSPNAYVLRDAMWWAFQLKIFDYTETCIFVLRKKQRQISVLHVYHHVSLVTMSWFFLKYSPDIRASFTFLVNGSVHVVMYLYYLCAASGPKIQRIIAPIKPYITKLQMVQFLVLMAYATQGLLPSCGRTIKIEAMAYIFIVNVSIYMLLFYNFYKENYTKTCKQKS